MTKMFSMEKKYFFFVKRHFMCSTMCMSVPTKQSRDFLSARELQQSDLSV